ncbi:YjfB family protein [Aquibacillus sediminis]|uniref:YjfB family protein n=1 Tax=Aquibacillus sediminis TaxID=2574734 RepID=UPI0011086E55|nr:YjfB family protein [Aquibacillus sediminis]
MDVAAMSMAMSTANVKQQASVAVMDKAMSQSETQGQSMVNMLEQSNVQQMEQSVSPHLGSSVDMKA